MEIDYPYFSVIPFRLEAAACLASLPGMLKIRFYCTPFVCTSGQRVTRRQWNSNYNYAVNWTSLVVMRLKIQEQSELNFVSRIIQWPLAMETVPLQWGKVEAPPEYY